MHGLIGFLPIEAHEIEPGAINTTRARSGMTLAIRQGRTLGNPST